MELVLLRHGYTQWNKERRYLGRTDLPLLPGKRIGLLIFGCSLHLAGNFSKSIAATCAGAERL